jgi:hypothetical protein
MACCSGGWAVVARVGWGKAEAATGRGGAVGVGGSIALAPMVGNDGASSEKRGPAAAESGSRSEGGRRRRSLRGTCRRLPASGIGLSGVYAAQKQNSGQTALSGEWGEVTGQRGGKCAVKQPVLGDEAVDRRRGTRLESLRLFLWASRLVWLGGTSDGGCREGGDRESQDGGAQAPARTGGGLGGRRLPALLDPTKNGVAALVSGKLPTWIELSRSYVNQRAPTAASYGQGTVRLTRGGEAVGRRLYACVRALGDVQCRLERPTRVRLYYLEKPSSLELCRIRHECCEKFWITYRI